MSSTAQIKYTRTEHSESSGIQKLNGLFQKCGTTELVVDYKNNSGRQLYDCWLKWGQIEHTLQKINRFYFFLS